MLFGIKPPYSCYAKLWSPSNMFEQCDCNIWCKYPPTRRKIYI